MMTDSEQRAAAKRFSEYWSGKGYEKGETQPFWISLLRDVFGVENISEYITFEEQVLIDHTNFMDGYIPSTKVMIEQKSIDKDLNKGIKQSDGSVISPYMQARRYITGLPLSKHPRWIITCNFKEFYIYDMEQPNAEPEKILLEDLPTEYYRLSFLVDTQSEHIKKETQVSIAAGEIVGKIYDAFYNQYKNPDDEHSQKSLNVLCVRLVFCLYAEDAGIFGHHGMFYDYLAKSETIKMRRALKDLFKILDTKPEDRDPYLADENPELAAFPYVNGGLFSDENIEIPQFTDEIRELLLNHASSDFDWSQISPTIFGAVFESTLNPETRRSGGMHYTSIENIHKVIDPLFLNDLKAELEEISQIAVEKTRNKSLKEFQYKLSTLKFFDPACGSGNFLTETYLCLRKLENKVLMLLNKGQIKLGDENNNPIEVSIHQFYGIEINDFAVTVAKTALWIAESQMMKKTEEVLYIHLDFLPLKSYTNIYEGNALTKDWEEIIPKTELSYIMGNPPFIGYSLQSKEQKSDILSIYVDEKGKPYKTAGKIDYVAGWYFKASQYIYGTDIKVAFVSTNSITQGEQVASVWKPLYDRFNIHIDFAHRTFIWDSEANAKAHVHCVIVGFNCISSTEPRKLYESGRVQLVENINPYLIEAPDVFIVSNKKQLCKIPSMIYGNKPTDGGFLFLTPEERCEVLKKEPEIEKYIRQIYGATEYINNKLRYCLWLYKCNPSDIRKSNFIKSRVEAVKEFRLNSTKEATRASAETPMLFQEIRQPESNYIIVPRHSSENRRYIPLGFVSPEIIVNDAVQIIPEATIYDFGILTSNVHMAWMRAVCGRIKSDYRYSKDIVYNNFPWPNPTEEQKARIEKTAQMILDARAKYPDCSLADLYDEITMPPELRKAHQENDRAVMAAYGFPVRGTTESSCVAELMKMYQKLTSK